MGFNEVRQIEDKVQIRNVIVSVFDKQNLDSILIALLRYCPGVRFYSTGGTFAHIETMLGERAGAHLVSMSLYTGQPEMKGGLVKTLDWKIYLGILAEPYDEEHKEDLFRHHAVAFDMVIGNLYPFEEAAATARSFEAARQHIDIGGPTLLRAAAKNFLRVCPVPSPDHYPEIIAALERYSGCVGLEERRHMAEEVFTRQSAYDKAIGTYLSGKKENIAESYKIN